MITLLKTLREHRNIGRSKWLAAIVAGLVLLPTSAFASEEAAAPEMIIDTGTTAWMLVSTALVLRYRSLSR